MTIRELIRRLEDLDMSERRVFVLYGDVDEEGSHHTEEDELLSVRFTDAGDILLSPFPDEPPYVPKRGEK